MRQLEHLFLRALNEAEMQPKVVQLFDLGSTIDCRASAQCASMLRGTVSRLWVQSMRSNLLRSSSDLGPTPRSHLYARLGHDGSRHTYSHECLVV